MRKFKRGLIIGVAAMTAFFAINMSVAAENEDTRVFVYKEAPQRDEILFLRVGEQIKLTVGGNNIELANRPVILFDTVYVPLREILEKLNKDNYEETVSIVWNDGTIYLGLYDWSDTLLCQIKIDDSGVKFKRVAGNHLSNTSFAEENISYTNIEGKPAILRGESTYISVDMLNYIIGLAAHNNSNPEQFEVKYTVTTYDGGNWYFDKECHNFFEGTENPFSMNIPNWWNGKYETVQDNNVTKVYHKEIRKKYGEGMGLLFYIEENTAGVDGISAQKLLTQVGEYKYVYGIPTDVQYPTNTTTEGKRLQEEYRQMQADLTYIRDSFRSHLLSVVEWENPKLTLQPVQIIDTPNENSVLSVYTSPYAKSDVSYVVNNFLRCLESSAFEEMKNYCTINCIRKYFGEDGVFGIKSAVINTVSYPFGTDDNQEEKEIGITAKITPAENSTFGKKEITLAFKLHLIKQADGTYLIDSFGK